MPAVGDSRYADAELRYTRWLEKFQLDRSRHARVRRAPPDPAALDAELADVLHGRQGLSCYASEATDLLLGGARMVEPSSGLLGHKLSSIVYMLEVENWSRPHLQDFLDSQFQGFLDALTASGSVAILDSWAFCTSDGYNGRGVWEQLPFGVLQTVAIGEPWGIRYYPKAIKLGSLDDLAVRRACLRLLARMAFLSAEHALGRGDAHPFMVLLQTYGGRRLCPFASIQMGPMVHPTNQAAVLHVVYLLEFIYRRLPWTGQHQHLADVEHASMVLSCPLRYWGLSPGKQADQLFHQHTQTPLVEQMMGFGMLVSGTWKGLFEGYLGHLFKTYCFFGHFEQREAREDQKSTPDSVKSASVNKLFFSNRKSEQKLIRLFEDNGHISSWICGGGLCLLLNFCRQRRRRVLQVSRLAGRSILWSSAGVQKMMQGPARPGPMPPTGFSRVLRLSIGEMIPLLWKRVYD